MDGELHYLPYLCQQNISFVMFVTKILSFGRRVVN